MKRALAGCALALVSGAAAAADAPRALQPMDVFALEYASDPQIAPDGSRVVYVRSFMDVMKDRRRSNLWIVGEDGTKHRPLTSGNRSDASPRWSPSGDRLAWVSSDGDTPQVHVRYTDTGESAVISRLADAPSGLDLVPGRTADRLLHARAGPGEAVRGAARPARGGRVGAAAEGRHPARVPRGRGGVPPRRPHASSSCSPADGGTPRQLTDGPFDHEGRAAWTPDGAFVLVSANRHEDGEYDPANTEVYEVARRRRDGPRPDDPPRAGRAPGRLARRPARSPTSASTTRTRATR